VVRIQLPCNWYGGDLLPFGAELRPVYHYVEKYVSSMARAVSEFYSIT
jgi:hypothetical protein